MSFNNFFIHNKLFFLLLLLSLLLNLYLIDLPLIKEFSYEFAVVNGLIFFLFIPILLFSYNRNNRNFNIKILHISILIFAPIIIVLFKFIFTRICAFFDGLNFYLLIAVISGVIAYFLSEISYYLSQKKFFLVYFISLIVLISIPVIELINNPQIYFYSPLIGFFPGSIYDEDISINMKLISYRILNLIFFFSFYIIIIRNIVKRKYLIFLLIIIGTIFSFLLSPAFGFSTTENRLKSLLPDVLEQENIKIYSKDLDQKQKILLLNMTELFLSELTNQLNIKAPEKISIFIFSNAEEKRKYFGSENADVAKPWLNQIYLSKETWQSTLKHELAHILSAEFGRFPLKLAADFNPFLIEGFATAMDPFYDFISIDYLAALHYKFYRNDVFNNIIQGFNFFSVHSTIAYIYAGSFSKFLINNYGIEKYKQYYSSNNFFKSYKLSFDTIIEEYKKYLQKIDIDSNIHKFNYYFGRKSIIQKNCPRFIEKQIKKGWTLFHKGDINSAEKVFKEILQYSNNYFAVIGYTECLIKKDLLTSVENLLKKYIHLFSNTPFNYLLRFKLADIYVNLNKIDEAYKIYSQLETENPNLYLSALSDLRVNLVEKNLIKQYISSNDSTKFEILVKLNKDSLVYSSIPTMITLAKKLNITYDLFLKYFQNLSLKKAQYYSFALMNLSQFMLEHNDYIRAKKINILAIRYNSEKLLEPFLTYNLKMIKWLRNDS